MAGVFGGLGGFSRFSRFSCLTSRYKIRGIPNPISSVLLRVGLSPISPYACLRQGNRGNRGNPKRRQGWGEAAVIRRGSARGIGPSRPILVATDNGGFPETIGTDDTLTCWRCNYLQSKGLRRLALALTLWVWLLGYGGVAEGWMGYPTDTQRRGPTAGRGASVGRGELWVVSG